MPAVLMIVGVVGGLALKSVFDGNTWLDIGAGAGRYGAILWVAPRDVSKAAKLLGPA